MRSRSPSGRGGALARNRPTPSELGRWARAALTEDRWDRDVTSRAVVPARLRAVAVVRAQATGVLAGVPIAVAVARAAGVRIVRRGRDGDRVRNGTAVLVLEGRARAILAAERTVLNFLMHLSGVATATARAVRAVGPQGPEVRATRKTLPGLRDLEKSAVQAGGGLAHRRDVSAAVLVKNNHLALVPLRVAVRRARRSAREVEVEVRSLAEAREAVRCGATELLLDNRTPVQVRRIVRGLDSAGLRSKVTIEVSGGITPSTAMRYRSVGADSLSLGALTHSAPALPMHLEFLSPGARSVRGTPPRVRPDR